MHLNLDNSIAATSFTASAFHIEAESPFLVSTNFRFIRQCEDISNIIEYASICGRIRARSATDRRLIDVHDFVQMLDTMKRFMRSRPLASAIQITCQCFV